MEYLRIQDAAQAIGLSTQTILKYCNNGVISGCHKRGRTWLIPEEAISQLIREKTRSFRFIDLFCGIGGFHQAMRSLGGKCVFACDVNTQCREVYKKNFCPNEEFPLHGDIVDAIRQNIIPEFDVLCGGFPCQTFSKAGLQGGFEIIEKENGEIDERGQLFYRIIDILKSHPECKFLVLENVRNLADKKENWEVICKELKALNFIITEDPIIESPHHFGIPQVRERVFILGIRKEALDGRRRLDKGYLTKSNLHIEKKKTVISENHNCLSYILDASVDKKYLVSNELEEILNIWEEFRANVKGLASPFWIQKAGIGIYDQYEYTQNPEIGYLEMPEWKKILVNKSRRMYEENTEFIDEWIERHHMLDRQLLHQKFEWNAGQDCNSMHEGIIQVRQSGIRVKRPNYFPSLVVMKNTPIVWDKHYRHYRYITPKEAAKLQSFDIDFIFSDDDTVSYKQLGNSVNVELLRIFSKELFKYGKL